MQWGGDRKRSGEGQGSPFVGNCRTTEKHVCHSKIHWAFFCSAERTEGAAGHPFFPSLPAPNPAPPVPRDFGLREMFSHTGLHLLRVIHWSTSEFLRAPNVWSFTDHSQSEALQVGIQVEFCIVNKFPSDPLAFLDLKGATTV